MQHGHGLEGFAARGPNQRVRGLGVHLLERLPRFGVEHLKAADRLQCDRRIAPGHGPRQRRTHRHRPYRRRPARFLRKGAIHPAVARRFDPRRPGLHVVLRVEMRARGIGRTRGIDNRHELPIEQRLERSKGRMQPEEPVQIDRCVRDARSGPGDRDRRPQIVVRFLPMRHDDIQSVRRPALKNRDQDLLPRRRGIGGVQRPRQPKRSRAHAHHRQSGIAQKNPSLRSAFFRVHS